MRDFLHILFLLLPILPLLTFLVLRFVGRVSLLKTSVITIIVFIVFLIFYWQFSVINPLVSLNYLNHDKGYFLAQVGGGDAKKQTGMNLYEINDWQPAWVFVDIMNLARDWSDCGKWDATTTVPLDSNGYPTKIPFGGVNCVETIWAQNVWTHWPAGQYTLTFEGKGTVRLKNIDYSSTGGKVTFTVNFAATDGAPILMIRQSDENDPIRNMHLIMPGYSSIYATQVFHPDFLKGLEGVDELRFMNWMRTNYEWADSEPAVDFFDWKNRTKATSFTQSRQWGVSPEYLVGLANRVKADAWINIPYTASDDYVTNYAKFLNDNLDDNLKVYIEYSNEIWNSGTFRHYQYTSRKGLELGLSTDPVTASFAYQVYRSTQIFKIFRDQFADDSRLINVVASQAANSWLGKQLLLNSDNSKYNPNGMKIDALAIAPYFGVISDPGSNDDVYDVLLSSQQGIYHYTQTWVRANLNKIKEYCNNKGLSDKCVRLVTYEGGQHLRSADTTINAKFIEANRTEGMGGLFGEMFRVWEAENPGELFTIFDYSSPFNQYGSWGMYEHQDEMETPKYYAYRRRLGDSSVPPCSESWSCSEWSPSACPESEVQTRNCTDGNICGTTITKPTESQSCEYTLPSEEECVESWSCSEWSPSVCSSSGSQTRTCTDGNVCGTTTAKPIESQSCTYVAASSGGGGGGGNTPIIPEESKITILYNQVVKLQRVISLLLIRARISDDNNFQTPKEQNKIVTKTKVSSETEVKIKTEEKIPQKLTSGLPTKFVAKTIPKADNSFYYSYPLTSDSKLGDRGKEIKALQVKLNKLGYTIVPVGPGSPGFETDYFGVATKEALIRYQLQEEIILDSKNIKAGVLEQKTRESLNEQMELSQ